MDEFNKNGNLIFHVFTKFLKARKEEYYITNHGSVSHFKSGLSSYSV